MPAPEERYDETDKHAMIRELMDSYGKDIWNLAYSILRKVDMADDVTQDVFLTAFQKLDSFRGDSSIKTWLLRIARNRAFDYRRTFFFKKITLVEFIIERGQHPSAEQEAVQHHVEEKIWQAVLSLPVKYREVLVLHGYHQLSAAEIAEVLDTSLATVKTRLHRARAKITELLPESER